MQTQLNFTIGQHYASLAANKADTDHEGWKAQAWELFLLFIAQVQGEFQIEDFRAYAYQRGLPVIANQRAFGWLPTKAKNMDLIVSCGVNPTKNLTAHHNYSTVWRRVNGGK